ncbi:MAG TPA: phosphodiester glycosidase family protein [Kofleriaceae bacterium]|nr:phosphodiester glycosidase family protein [Kofleriaceae bacterium]
MKVAVAALLVLAAEASAAPSLTSSSDPYPGIHREIWRDTDPQQPVIIRLMRIDLSSSEIAVYATKEADRGLTTSDYAARVGAQVAINGDSFAVNGYVPRGLAVGDSSTWANTADDARSAVFHVRRVGERTIAGISADSIVAPGDLPDGTEGVISGRPLLVRQSQVATDQINCNDPITMDCQVAPRTAIAVSPDGNRLWLAVVDGWQNASYGMTLPDLAEFLRQRGAGMAMALDSGSSSTLVQDGSPINVPSDGLERTVANHLAIKYGSLPKGELFGLICKHSVVNCGTDVPSRKISGATVILDDTRTQTTDATGTFDFQSVTPRLACVTVKKTGYLTVTQCRQVEPGQLTYNSVALWEGTDSPDAGVGEDAGIGTDASTVLDAQTSDAGNGYDGPGGGCCDSGRDRPDVALLVVVAFILTRRRGTTA